VVTSGFSGSPTAAERPRAGYQYCHAPAGIKGRSTTALRSGQRSAIPQNVDRLFCFPVIVAPRSCLPFTRDPGRTAGRRHFSRRRLLSITLFGSPASLRWRFPQKAMTAALRCAGLTCLFRPRRGGHSNEATMTNLTTDNLHFTMDSND
jgi:hypothetical protein